MNRRDFMVAGALLTAHPVWAGELSSESERLNRFFEDVFDRRVARSPGMQSNLGVKSGLDRWPDASEARAAEDAALVRADLAALRRFDVSALTPEAKLSRHLFEYEGQQALVAHRWSGNHYPVCQMRGPQRSIPQTLINNHAIGDLSDAEAYVARLRAVKPYLAEIVVGLQRQAMRGVRPPAFSYPLVIGNCQKLISGAPFDVSGSDSPVLADFKAKIAKLDLSDGARVRLIANAEAAMREGFGPGFTHLIAHLRSSAQIARGNDGVWSLPNGDAYYAASLQMHTTLPASAREVHHIGLQEVARLHGEIDALRKRFDFTGSRAAFFAHIRSSTDFHFPDTAEGRARYLDTMRGKIAEVSARLGELTTRTPKAKVIVKPVEPWLEASAGTAGYFAPSADGSRPGILYINTRAMRNLPIYEISALAYHEGVPGHHLEVSISRELEGLPRFRRFGGYTAFSEGWALFAEQLPREMGLYPDPWQEFGRLSMELMRAGRLVVDTGVHSLRWSREKAVAWLDANTAANHDDNVTAVQRYIVTPGQACAYEMGKLKLVELCDRARAKLADFDIRRFNDKVLGSGPLPLPLLEANIDDWIAQGGTAA